ncbi:class I SAM-dependent methyltransferase [Pseudonocardia sediminis]|nr:class I SAM-dependent methyltransferase [Pseudonocardia sediminis]
MRRDDDQWDITTSVGATALAVAAGRAVETKRSDGLVNDPYAQAFVDATGKDMPDRPFDDEAWAAQATYLGVRSRFFDDCLSGAAQAGAEQVVILAAGLDTRAFRLSWPAGVTVYEIDQSAVLDFKDRILDQEGADTAAGRIVVPVDLRHDWPAALTGAGFDPSRRTVWLAEGLLPYLPAAAEHLLFERVQELSAPGSRIAVEHFGGSIDKITSSPEFQTMSQQVIGADVRTLFFSEDRDAAPDVWLSGHGWTVTSSLAGDLAQEYGRPLPPGVAEVMGGIELMRADLTG